MPHNNHQHNYVHEFRSPRQYYNDQIRPKIKPPGITSGRLSLTINKKHYVLRYTESGALFLLRSTDYKFNVAIAPALSKTVTFLPPTATSTF